MANPNHDNYEERIATSNRRTNMCKWATAGLLSTSGVLATQNFEFIQAAEAYVSYQEPAEGDIIPERIGECPADTSMLTSGYSNELKYVKAVDADFVIVHNKVSAAKTFKPKVMGPDGYLETTKIVGLSGSYFDTHVASYTSSWGVTHDISRSSHDDEFHFSVEALEQMVSDIFTLPDIYDNPRVQAIIDCKRQQLFLVDDSDGVLAGAEIDINIISNPNKSLDGFDIATLAHNHKLKSHAYGFGIFDIGFNIAGIQLTPDGAIIVTAGNETLEDNPAVLNKRFMHELMHTLFFHDLSDTASEYDEQERFVQYVTLKLMSYYHEHGGMPMVIAAK